MKFYARLFFENLSRKYRFHLNRTRISDTLREDQYIFLIISGPLLRTRNVYETEFVQKIRMYFYMFEKILFIKIVPLMRQCGKIS